MVVQIRPPRRLTLTVPARLDGQSVDFLLRQVLRLSGTSVKRAKAVPGGITLDGTPVTVSQRAPAGALLAAAAAVLVNLLSAALTATLAAFILLRLEGRWDRRLLPALGLYWLFLLSWLPITVGSFLRGTTRWEEIRHTRNVTPEALAR